MRGIAFSTVQALDRETDAANSKTLRQILDILLKVSPANGAAPSRDKHQRASLSFALFGANTELYRKRLKAVHLENRGKQLRADSGISESFRRAPALIGGVFMLVTWQGLALPIYGGLLTGSRKACRYLKDGYSTPDSNPRPSSGIESGLQGNSLGGHYHGKNSAYPHARIHPHYPAHLFSPHNCGPGASICLVGGAP